MFKSLLKNHGKTIAPEQLDSIFEKFSRLDEARLSDTGGAGLGLSISEEIIHLHGGTITASSEKRKHFFYNYASYFLLGKLEYNLRNCLGNSMHNL